MAKTSKYPMVEVDAALQTVLQHAAELPEIRVSLDGLAHRTLQKIILILGHLNSYPVPIITVPKPSTASVDAVGALSGQSAPGYERFQVTLSLSVRCFTPVCICWPTILHCSRPSKYHSEAFRARIDQDRAQSHSVPALPRQHHGRLRGSVQSRHWQLQSSWHNLSRARRGTDLRAHTGRSDCCAGDYWRHAPERC